MTSIATTWTRTMCAAMIIGGLAGNSAMQASGADTADPFGGKHVLIIGIDGCRSDAMQAAKKPNLQGLIDHGTVCWQAHSGGTIGTKTAQRLCSAPGWASILTAVWVDKHGVPHNHFKEFTPNFKKIVDGKNVGYPSFFARIKEKHPTAYLASIVHWKPINQQIVSDVDLEADGDDAEVAKKCAELLLGDRNPSVIFLQFDDVDHVGGAKGFDPKNPEYMETIELTDRHIGTVLDAMRKRPNFAKEDWLVLVTADHGGLGTNHGNQTPEERTVFLIASGGAYPHKVIDAEWPIVAIPPTVLKHLGIPVDPAWGWESPAFR
jgi:hypothetical protein